MIQRAVLITGANGGIGQALCRKFRGTGWKVIGTDRDATSGLDVDSYISMELGRLSRDTKYLIDRLNAIQAAIPETGLRALINNAAIQIVSPVEQLTADDWHTTLDVNLLAPFLLTQALLPELEKAKGSVINIASIHAQLTKPHFSAYATSKAALVGLTRSLAVELGSRVRVNAICPAAIATPMLVAGFDQNPGGLDELASYHPTGTIGTPDEVALAALYLADANSKFLNGAVLELNGGIAARLHDPELRWKSKDKII
ncbi:MAG: SDR family oxidoreductase [Gammaproteobacteria bacterium]|nr:SDR family oxidoreductase [Gammaproteobacteria bacterium]